MVVAAAALVAPVAVTCATAPTAATITVADVLAASAIAAPAAQPSGRAMVLVVMAWEWAASAAEWAWDALAADVTETATATVTVVDILPCVIISAANLDTSFQPVPVDMAPRSLASITESIHKTPAISISVTARFMPPRDMASQWRCPSHPWSHISSTMAGEFLPAG